MKIQIIKTHLIILLAVYLLACTTLSLERQGNAYKDITPIQAKGKIDKSRKVLLLDVRTRDEFLEGHIPGAINIPVDELESRLDELKRYANFEIIVYCRSGNRSKRASEFLVKQGFKHIYNLSGGIIEWRKTIEGRQYEKNHQRYNN